jgi:hypothetical protein
MSSLDRTGRESPFLRACSVVFSYTVAVVLTIAGMAAFFLLLFGLPLAGAYLGVRKLSRRLRDQLG